MDQRQQLPLDGENAGEWVERNCRDLDISVAKLAQQARVNRTTIYRWKKGHTDPNWHSLRSIHGVIKSIWEKKECG